MLAAGTKLGPYEVVSSLGAGGMGEVYRARDSRLNRDVALKILPDAFARDPDRVSRFRREAQVLASLSHPNIGHIYGFEETTTAHALVLELIEGPTLADRIAEGPIPLADALSMANQISHALKAAHEQGIVHRDLKPPNIKITSNGVKVLDFGLAKMSEAAEANALTMTAEDGTLRGTILGTPAYMSPEQAEGLPLDPRTDLWSLGVVLYEMLTQRRPFAGATAQRTLIEILQRPTPSVPGVPRQVEQIVERCLEKKKSARYPSANALIEDLEACTAAVTTDRVNVRALLSAMRRPRFAVPGLLILVTLASIASWWLYRSAMRDWARDEAVPQAHLLADKGEYVAAYRLAVEAERYIANEPALNDLWPDVSRLLSVHSDPSGAEVAWKPYDDDAEPWQPLGLTPVVNYRLPTGPGRLRIVKAGYITAEVAAASADHRITLVPEGDVPADLVRVPAGRLSAQYSGIGDLTASLSEFDIDRHEVTNRQFKNFVDAGGYRNRAYWTTPFVENGVEVSWETAMARFVDPTRRPGPSTWEAGTYPEGREDYPVTGLSWYEAAAYAAFVGRTLPTVYHWYRAASTDDSRFLIARSNFAGSGPLPRGRSGALGSFGTVDMAGNVREWCWNETSGQRYILGGSWADPSYMLMRGQLASPWDRSSTNGFRCAKYLTGSQSPNRLTEPITATPRPAYLSAPAVPDNVFHLYEDLYAYERSDLNAVVDAVDETSDLWRRQIIRFDAAYGHEQVIAYLFLPRHGKPPYACVIDVPSVSEFRAGSGKSIRPQSYILRSGRAMLYPIFKGTYERFAGAPSVEPVAIRDTAIQWRKDLGRSIDYLLTRPDIDGSKLTYLGRSLGSEVAPLFLAVERRFAAAVLLSGGLTPFFGKLPEINAVNFLPRVTTPVLMVNGRYDSILPVELAQQPMFQRLGTPVAHKRHVIVETGHAVLFPEVRNEVIREVLDWLDRYLGAS